MLKKLNNSIEIESFYTVYAPPASSYELGKFINASGVATASATHNYAIVRYNVGANCVWTRFTVSQVYVPSGTAYSVVAFYDNDDTFISSVLSSDYTGGRYNAVSGTIPPNTAYMIVTYGGFASLANNVNATYVYGKTAAEAQKTVASGRPDNNTLQLYLSIPNSESSQFIAANGNIKVPERVISSVDFYFTTYDTGYTNRQLFRHITGVTHTDHEVDIHDNSFVGTNMPATTSAYIGIVINITLAAPATSTGASAIQNMNTACAVLTNFTINNTPITNVRYPQGPAYTNYGVQMNEGYNPLMGARICCLGDSLTAVYYKTEEESWPYLIAKWNNARVDNLGVSSCPLTQYNYSGDAISTRAANLSSSKYYTHFCNGWCKRL